MENALYFTFAVKKKESNTNIVIIIYEIWKNGFKRNVPTSKSYMLQQQHHQQKAYFCQRMIFLYPFRNDSPKPTTTTKSRTMGKGNRTLHLCVVYMRCVVYIQYAERERDRERREHKIHIFDVLSWILLYILWKWILWSGWMVFLFYFVFDISKGVVYSACTLHNVSEAHINIRTKIMLVENIRKKKTHSI